MRSAGRHQGGLWKACLAVFVLLLTLTVAEALAAAGDLDNSFSGDGKRIVSFGTSNDLAGGVAVQPNGRIVVGGQAYRTATGPDFALLRLRRNGSLDPSFSTNGKLTTSFANGTGGDGIGGVTLQNNGKIVVAGVSDQTNAARTSGIIEGNDFALARYLPDGRLDHSFSSNGKQTVDFAARSDEANDVAIQSDGRIVAAGTSINGSGKDTFAVARLHRDGSIDHSFAGNGRQTTTFGGAATGNFGRGVAIQPNGRIIVAGASAQAIGNDYRFAVARYMPGGDLDHSFDGNGKKLISFDNGTLSDSANDVAIQDDGKIILVGYSYVDQQGALQMTVARIGPHGALDHSFSDDGKRSISFGDAQKYDFANSVAIQGNGTIVLAGASRQTSSGNFDLALARLTPKGNLDHSFSGNGKQVTSMCSCSDYASSVAVHNGRIVAAGTVEPGSDYNFAVARYLGG